MIVFLLYLAMPYVYWNRTANSVFISRANDGWGDETWTSDWGNNSQPNSPGQTSSTETSPNSRVSKKNANNATKKNRSSTKKVICAVFVFLYISNFF